MKTEQRFFVFPVSGHVATYEECLEEFNSLSEDDRIGGNYGSTFEEMLDRLYEVDEAEALELMEGA